MKTLATIVTMLLFASIVSGQDAALKPKLHEVKQGEAIPFNITVKPAPNVGGSLTIYAKSVSSDMKISGGQGMGPNQNTIDNLALSIPIDGTPGKWTVTRVTFTPSPGGTIKDLNVADLPSFEVVERKTVEPDSAVVEVK
jgi:hypothetical protein